MANIEGNEKGTYPKELFKTPSGSEVYALSFSHEQRIIAVFRARGLLPEPFEQLLTDATNKNESIK